MGKTWMEILNIKSISLKLIKILCIIYMFLFLNGCAKKELSTQITDSLKSDVTVIEKELSQVENEIEKVCETKVFSSKIENIREQIKSLANKADNIDAACKSQNQILKEENSKLKWIIFFLLIIGCFLIYLLIMKRKIL